MLSLILLHNNLYLLVKGESELSRRVDRSCKKEGVFKTLERLLQIILYLNNVRNASKKEA